MVLYFFLSSFIFLTTSFTPATSSTSYDFIHDGSSRPLTLSSSTITPTVTPTTPITPHTSRNDTIQNFLVLSSPNIIPPIENSNDNLRKSRSSEEKTAILHRLIALNPNIPEEYRGEATALAQGRNQHAMHAFNALKTRNIDGTIQEEQKKRLKTAQTIFRTIGTELKLPDMAYPHLLICLGQNTPYLNLDAIAKIFKDAKNPTDFTSALPRLAYTALNATLVGSDLTEVQKNGVAADCFYLLTRYWDHHAQKLYPWLKDLRLLPCHRQYKEECDELMTMEGKRNVLSFFVDGLPSMGVTAKWGMYRMVQGDRRKAILHHINETLWAHVDDLTYYVKNIIPQQPQFRELLSFGSGLMKYSKKMTYFHQPLTRDQLYIICNQLLYGLQHGTLDEDGIYPNLTWTESHNPVSYLELKTMSADIIHQNQHTYETEFSPLFHKLSKSFFALKKQQQQLELMAISDMEEDD